VPVPTAIAINGQTPRRLRYQQIRGMNTIDDVVMLHDLYAAADVPATLAADKWSAPLNVQAFDRVCFFVDWTAGGTARDLKIAVQASFAGSSVADYWYDRATDFDLRAGGASSIAVVTPTWAAASGSGRFSFDVETLGHYIRIQPYLSGASVGSRVTIRAHRTMYQG
jgi:hypothetical protein